MKKSAEQGNAYAQSNLGGFYERGEGVEKDLNKACEWYQKSAEQGEDYPKYLLERLKEKMKKNEKEAKRKAE